MATKFSWKGFFFGCLVGAALYVLFSLSCASVHGAQFNESKVIQAVVGEASGEPYQCQVAICAVIRTRGNLNGVYGINATHVASEPKWVFTQVHRAWLESATNDVTHGCNMWGGKMDDHYFQDVLHLKPVIIIGHTRFYKSLK